MNDITQRLTAFVAYAKLLKGDEKGEAQVFCDRLFRAFGHDGYAEAGATLEFRIQKASGKGVNFADLVWKPRLLLEMKKSGEKLALHYQQAFDYWLKAVPDRPRYVVLCNFAEFWIYDLDKQLNEPVDIVPLDELVQRYTALNFLFPDDPPPLFGNDREEVSRTTAAKMAKLFRSMVDRGVPRDEAQRWVLQAILAMFAEDIQLMPAGIIIGLVRDCLHHGQNAYDIFGGLFRQMDAKKPAPAGRYKGVPYFNGGLFAKIEPVDLTEEELLLVGEPNKGAAWENWSKINPSIFGTIFQQSMDKGERHAYGAHFTHESDIQRIVGPTISKPWRERIDAAKTMKDLVSLRTELADFTVLDPACGSGNFLYVAYRELVRLEIQIMARLEREFSWQKVQKVAQTTSIISPRRFFGLDRDSFGVELAKVTLMIGKKLALEEAASALRREQIDLPLATGEALPLDNLDKNIVCADALFTDWPKVDVIIGNPPYQSKGKAQKEFGRAYMNRVRATYPEVDGRADYCVYWFRKAHDALKPGQRAGFVGTNTVRQNYSRMSGLDHIVADHGTITEAVSTMSWSGDASVDVSIVNWIKGESPGNKRLFIQNGGDLSKGWSYKDVNRINSALSFGTDVSSAMTIKANEVSSVCFQGQTPGHDGFLLTEREAADFISADRGSSEIIHPILIGNELTGQKDGLPNRYVIDFHPRDLFTAQKHKKLLDRIQKIVLPDREKAAKEEQKRNEEALAENPKASVARHHQGFLNRWWQLSWPRGDMKGAIAGLSRYIACSRVTLRPIFEFIDPAIRPNDLISVFAVEDDYSFGILQSDSHWAWFTHRCSTQNGRPRYTSESVFQTFPWPQSPTNAAVKRVADASVALRSVRRKLKADHNLSFRELYRYLDLPGTNSLKDAHHDLDLAVKSAYGMTKKTETLGFLLELNASLGAAEAKNEVITGPGLPASLKKTSYVTADRLHMPT